MISPDKIEFDVPSIMIGVEKHMEERIDSMLSREYDPDEGLYIMFDEMVRGCSQYDKRLKIHTSLAIRKMAERYTAAGWKITINDHNGWEDSRIVRSIKFGPKNEKPEPVKKSLLSWIFGI